MRAKRILAALTGICLAGSSLLGMGASAAVKCDCNGDGSFDIVDLISLTKYIHLQGKLAAPANADMDGDGEVDIFDLALMMRALVGLDTENAVVSTNLSAKMTPNLVDLVTIDEDFAYGQTQFALNLLRETAKTGENVLVSPYSVEQALAMTANGTAGQTRTEMETVLGSPLEVLNPAFYTMRVSKAENRPAYWDDYATLETANSIWVRDGYPVSDAFLQTNADYYGAQVYSTPMNEQTMNDVNCWVDEHTDHMIPTILDLPPTESAMLLVNAVTFDGLWVDSFQNYSIKEESFTRTDGTQDTVDMMYSQYKDALTYVGDDHADGFIKPYQGGQYAFVALRPEEGMTPEQYLNTLTAAGWLEMLQDPNDRIGLSVGMPAFSYDYDILLNDPLSDLGMPTAFSESANFSGMTVSPNSLHIEQVIHKTHIEVNATGTKAAAATLVDMTESALQVDEFRTIILDRPFVYAIVDLDNHLPIFIGTVHSVE